MKRFLLFLVLLAAGLGALRWIQGPGPLGHVDRKTDERPPWARDVDERVVGLTPGGGVRVNQYLDAAQGGRRPTRFVLDAADSGATEDGRGLFFLDVELLYLDPETGSERMRLTATQALAERVADATGFEPRIEREIKLADVEVTIYDGAPIVPLSMRVAELHLDIESRTLRSPSPVELSGPGLKGGGVGLFVDETARVLRIESGGELRLDGYAGGGSLTSTGPLVVRRPESPADEDAMDVAAEAVEVRASEGAWLGPAPAADADPAAPPREGLWAREIVLRGHEDATAGIALETIGAVGAAEGVRYALGPHELTGGRAHLELDEAGDPRFARITESPRAELAVDPAALGTFAALGGGDPERASAPGFVRVESDSVLTIDWDAGGTHFRADGPARVFGEETRLFSDGGVTGTVQPEASGASFECRGGVRLERDDAVLVTRELDATLSRDADLVPVLSVTARGRPLVTAAAEDGRELVLSSEGVLEFEQRGATWSVPRAERIDLTVFGEDRLHARADLIERLDPELLALVATGNVAVETKEGLAHGETLVVESPERFQLAGKGDERVTFESAEGLAEAGHVEREGERVTLRDRVEARLTPSARAGEVYDLDCDLLVIERVTVALDAGGTSRTLHLDATGVRHAGMRRPGEGLDLVCATLAGHYREDLDAEEVPRERFSSFHATEVERAMVTRDGEEALVTRISSDALGATRLDRFQPDTDVPGEVSVVAGEAVASGSVVFHGTVGKTPFNGTAGEVRIDHTGTLVARAPEGGRVFVSGALPSNGKPYELEALWVRATPDELQAAEPEIVVLRMGEGGADEKDVDIHARARRLASTREWLELEEDVHVEGISEDATPWRLDAGKVRFEGRVAPGERVSREDISALLASRGVRLELPDHGVIATGETLRAKRLSGLMRLEGVPARITRVAGQLESDWIELDVDLGVPVGSGKSRGGRRETDDSTQEDGGQEDGGGVRDGATSFEYESQSLLLEPDAFVFVLEEPRFHYTGPALRSLVPSLPSGDITVSATWAVLWVDRRSYTELLDGGLPPQPEPEPEGASKKRRGPDEPNFFERIRMFGVNEVYLEGPIEMSIDGQPSATASAIYLDVVSGNGWLADAVFTVTSDLVGRDIKKIKVQARWLRQSDDYSFFADEAKVSICEFEDPHLEITTGDLRITPSASHSEHFEVRLRDNYIRVYDLFTLPLPSIHYATDEKGKPIFRSLKIGNSARFGSFVSAGVVRPAENAGKALHGLLGRDEPDDEDGVGVDAQYNLDASWLGSRGVLLDLGFLAEAEGQYRWLTELGGIPDGREDKGFIRVDEDDRDTLRLWLRTRGRYWLGDGDTTWIDLAGTWQSDPGVQAEFFESQFTRYEQSETYLRWRRAEDELFLSAAAVVQADESFSGLSELPSLEAWRGRTEVLPLGPMSIQYGANAEAAYLLRRESEDGYASPFGLPAVFPDGLGDRETLRFDTQHLLEAPVGLGALGLRATPFALARFTAWSEDVTETDEPLRSFGQVGVRVATTLWRRSSGDRFHQLVPYVSARRDVALQESGGEPVAFDEVEEPLEGEFLDAGVRGRIGARRGGALLDLDLRATHVDSVPSGVAEGWTEVGMFSRLSIEPLGVPTLLSHDGRYDLEEGDTLYSRMALGLKPTDQLGFEAAHYRGLDLDREVLYEAASIRGLYTWTPKWEFEGRQTFSLLDDGDRLGSGVLLRRYGHDIVFEIESSYREGEGTSFGISLRPLFTYDRPDLGDVSF